VFLVRESQSIRGDYVLVVRWFCLSHIILFVATLFENMILLLSCSLFLKWLKKTMKSFTSSYCYLNLFLRFHLVHILFVFRFMPIFNDLICYKFSQGRQQNQPLHYQPYSNWGSRNVSNRWSAVSRHTSPPKLL